MSGSDDWWQRDQRDRELGAMGISTGSGANRQALDYRDAQQRYTQEITGNLYKQFQPKTSYPGHHARAPILPALDGSTSGPATLPISSTGVFLLLSALAGSFWFLVTGDLVSTGVAAGTTGGTLFGLRMLCRTRPAKLAGAFVATMVLAVFVICFLVIKAALVISIPATVVYLVWVKAGRETALWTAGGFLAFAALIAGVHWLKLRYQRFTATPKGKKFARKLGLVRFLLTLSLSGAGLWWVWNTFQQP